MVQLACGVLAEALPTLVLDSVGVILVPLYSNRDDTPPHCPVVVWQWLGCKRNSEDALMGEVPFGFFWFMGGCSTGFIIALMVV